MRSDNVEALRRELAAETNLMIVNLKAAVGLAEECRTRALQSEQLGAELVDVAFLMGDSARLLRAFGVVLTAALEKLPEERVLDLDLQDADELSRQHV